MHKPLTKSAILWFNLVCIMLLSYSSAAYAQSLSIADLTAYNWEGLLMGVAVSNGVSLLRTANTLANDRVLISSVLREVWRDVITASTAGGAAYAVMAAVASVGWVRVPMEIAMLVQMIAGWMRSRFLEKFGDGAEFLFREGLRTAQRKMNASLPAVPPPEPYEPSPPLNPPVPPTEKEQ